MESIERLENDVLLSVRAKGHAVLPGIVSAGMAYYKASNRDVPWVQKTLRCHIGNREDLLREA